MEQKVKIEYDNGCERFFFDHSFKTALEHAELFIENLKDKYDYFNLYVINNKSYGEKWILLRKEKKDIK